MMQHIPVYDERGKEASDLALDLATIERKQENPIAFSRLVRAMFQNWRQGTLGCKGRGDLAFSNKKPWRQKGTGRARVGSIRSPLWRKGGVMFGPQPRVRTLDVNDKERRLVFNNILFSVVDKNAVSSLNFVSADNTPSTKKAVSCLKNAGLSDKKVLLFLRFGDDVSFASFANIPNVQITFYGQPNAFDLTSCASWVFLKQDIDLFKEMILRWN